MNVLRLTTLVGLLAMMGFSSVASAHTYGGTLKAPKAAMPGPTDKFYIVCAPGTASLEYYISRTAPAAGTLKLQIKETNHAASVTTNGTKGTLSPVITFPATAGAHSFSVSKSPVTAAGTAYYTAYITCYDAYGVHQDSDQSQSVTYTQNQ
ncbi:MAG: hypothetical protein ABL933_01450 [Methyloglobulus sp.]|nr:hypothetical protein [Methyloglobulus sp.]